MYSSILTRTGRPPLSMLKCSLSKNTFPDGVFLIASNTCRFSFSLPCESISEIPSIPFSFIRAERDARCVLTRTFGMSIWGIAGFRPSVAGAGSDTCLGSGAAKAAGSGWVLGSSAGAEAAGADRVAPSAGAPVSGARFLFSSISFDLFTPLPAERFSSSSSQQFRVTYS